MHLEFAAPNRGVWTYMLAPGDTIEDELLPEGLEIVRRPTEDGFVGGDRFPGYYRQFLVNRATGGDGGASIRVDKMSPGGSGPALHIHRFDQYFMVFQGRLNLNIAGEEFIATPYDFVIIPAGVPHAMWNSGDEEERQVTIVAPEPVAGQNWDVEVDLNLREEWKGW
jgi:quercetin dioxygenase-like cupin family protein